ncbi:heme ABC transporter ATP-binding protein [Natranaerobius thermophilus]|uniref:ABC transporter related n=1 Tax=Natranaerobius thermophilus (strain ATCC BAA-1301 / DSM 18059 / JW/NM-WN-LF) TaxID=457570 RepID=B2A0Q0_NATTJ|nr:heme ABC transporter ATP-binding protein [Natranaerobius thermophilus]ACB85930.1 ABC transporter related [Natranaerobius thermophilus JW/NM-WN-LF]
MSVTLKVNNLSFCYPSNQVLSGLSFEIEPGAFTGIVGPNGSGKSTLLKNLTSYLEPEEGTIYLDDKKLADYNIRDLSKKQGVVSQDNQVNFNFSVYELVSMGRAPYMSRFSRMSTADREIVKMSMEDTNCWHLKDRQVFQLSGGERQRVIVARVLAQTPQLLLLDEPTTFLDLGYQKELMDLLARLNQERNLTVIMVLHDLNLASEYCRNLILMEQGEIVDMGSPEQVINEANLERVYKTKLTVMENPVTRSPMVAVWPGPRLAEIQPDNPDDQTIQPKITGKSPISDKKIHVISGGGEGTELLKELFLWDCQVSLGVVNLGDSDHKKAVDLGFSSVVCEPFSPIDEDSFQRAKNKILDSEAVILAPVPFGHGNLKNLELVQEAVNQGKPVALYKISPDEISDYTGGEGKQLLTELVDNYAGRSLDSAGENNPGLELIDSKEELLNWLKNSRSGD